MYYAGIDVGGTNIKAGIVDESYSLLYKSSIPTGVGRDAKEIIKDMADKVGHLWQIMNGPESIKDITSVLNLIKLMEDGFLLMEIK